MKLKDLLFILAVFIIVILGYQAFIGKVKLSLTSKPQISESPFKKRTIYKTEILEPVEPVESLPPITEAPAN